MNRPGLILCLMEILALTACAEAYKAPESEAPDMWLAPFKAPDFSLAQETEAKDADGSWWTQFKDATLNQLIEEAAANNYDLKVAQARIDEARALARYPSRFPELTLNGGYSRAGDQSALGGIDAGDTRNDIGVALSWDLDLNGKLEHGDMARDAVLGRVRAEYDLTRITLFAETAQSYAEIRYLQNLKKLTLKNIALQKETLRVIQLQQKAGATGQLDTIRAEAQVLHTEAQLPDIETSLTRARHRLSVLVGKRPGYVDRLVEKNAALPSMKKTAVLDSPAAVIARRPDVRAAELTFQEAVELKNVSTAELFPDVSLSGLFGLGTSSVYGASTPWLIGAGLFSPLIDFGRIESRIDTAEARKQQALFRYKKTVLSALEEVETVLVAFINEKVLRDKLEAETVRRQKAVQLARTKFDAGEVGFLDVLNEEEKTLLSESMALRSRFMTTKDMISLYKALGCAPTLADPSPSQNPS